MAGTWFHGKDRRSVSEARPRQAHKPLARWNVLLFEATGACTSGLAGQVHYDPRTGLRRL